MRQYLLLLTFLFVFFSSALQAQNFVVTDSSGRWKLGFNMGAAWQRGDVRAVPGLGGGVTLEWALIQNTHSWLGLSLRGRYLSATTYGRDYVKDSINYLNNPFLNGSIDPNMNYTAQGGVYQNYKTKLTEWTFEGMLYANRLRAKGILLYGFGGIGTTIFRGYTDQKNDATGQIYDYSNINGFTNDLKLTQLKGLRDGKYETQFRKPQYALSPSFGIGLGFMLGKRASFGFEHKLTFPTTDRLDGVEASNHYLYIGNHDMYHYSSASLTFTLGKGHGRYRGTNYTQNYQTTTVQPPYINTSRPTANPYTAPDCRADILADIENINSVYDIEVYLNGSRLNSTNYQFNSVTKVFHLDIAISGTAAFTIIAKNSAGSVNKDYTFVCPPVTTTPVDVPQPTIIIYSPTTNPTKAENCYADIYAKINNIESENNIEVKQNNKILNSSQNGYSYSPYSYNAYTKEFRLNTHIDGNVTFTITATNKAGKAISSLAFSCQPPPVVTTPQYVTICHVPQGDPTHPVTITIDETLVQSHLAHGDHLGSCPVVVTTNTNNCANFTANIAAQDHVSCFGGNNGHVNVTATGGTMPYSYRWSNGASSQDISNLTAGAYTVTVRDANGCSTSATATVTQPSRLTVNATSTNTCAGSASGTATASVSGGTSPYRYHWTNNQNTQSISNLGTGIYSVTVTDANNCSANASLSVNQYASLALSLTSVPVTCRGGNNGSINLTALGGLPPYSYSWSNGAKTQDISNLPTGSYTVTVADSKGCMETATASISEPDLLTINSGVNGNSASVTANGGTAPYTYTWSNGVQGANLSSLSNGSYIVTATDARNCKTTSTVIINYTPVPNCSGFAASIASQSNVSCYGGNNGNINLNVSGGLAPYKYSWSNGASTQDLSSLAAGTYSVTVTDANSCKATASATVIQPAALVVSASGTSTCPNMSTGTASVSITGGNSPYTYKWSNGATEQNITDLSAGTYSVTVNDEAACKATASVTIGQATAISLSVNNTNVSCHGGNNGSINLNASGGVAPYTYSWSTGANTQDIASLAAGGYSVSVTDSKKCVATLTTSLTEPAALNVTSSVNGNSALIMANGGVSPYTYSWTGGLSGESQSNLKNGSYTVTVTDANKCMASTNILVNKPVIVIDSTVSSCNGFAANVSSQTNISCNGSNDGSINIGVSGGTPPYLYKWNNGATSQDISRLSAGTYTVTVSDQHRCTATASAVITQPAALAVKFSGTNTCPGASTGSATASVSGGVSPYLYKWSNGESTSSIRNIADGSYSVTVTDSKGCSANGTVTIAPSSAMNLTAAATNITCSGNANGSINLSITGGSAPYKYKWSNGAITEDLSNLAPGSYTVTVTDIKNCPATASATITAPEALTASSSNNGNNASVSANGGTPPYSYTWTGGLSGAAQNNLDNGTYTITVTDANKCTATTSIVINKVLEDKCAGFATAIASQDNPSCNAGNDGRISIVISGGAAPFSYTWSNSATSKDLINIPAGSYSVEVKDANNCSAKATTVLSQPAAFTASASGTSSCAATATGTASVSISGGAGPYTYKWSNGSADQSLSGLEAGTYSVTVTDASGCQASSSATVASSAAINVTSSTVSPACHGQSNGSINLTVTGGSSPFAYQWSNGSVLQDLNNIPAGSYSVTVTDMKNCTVSASISISEPAALSAASSVHEKGAVVTANGGTAPYQYSWNNGLSGASQNNLENGTYTVTVTDANKCTATASVIINVIPEEKITICHKDGNNYTTIEIAASALSAHLAHGDQAGACVPKTETPKAEETITICHIPPGNPDNPQSITIPKSALPAHLAHGDQVGECPPKKDKETGNIPKFDATPVTNNGCESQPAPSVSCGGSFTKVLNSSASVDGIKNGESVCITAANYSGNINNMSAGTLVICSSVNSFNLSYSGGEVIIMPSANVTFASFNMNSANCKFTNYGTISFSNSLSVSGTLNNYGIMDVGGTFQVNAGSGNVYNGNKLNVGGDFNNLYTTTNSGKINVGGNFQNNGSSSTLFSNKCSLIIGGNLIVNTPTVFINKGTVTTGGNTTVGGTFTTYPGSKTSTKGLMVNGKVNGDGGSCSTINASDKVTLNGGSSVFGTVDICSPNPINMAGGTVTKPATTDCSFCKGGNDTPVSTPLDLNIASTNDVNCSGGSDGSLTFSSNGGTVPVSFDWTPRNGSLNGRTITGLKAGKYTITAKDANGAVKTTQATISEPSAIQASTSVNSASATVSVNGGTAPYTYKWTPGNYTNASQSGLANGSYSVKITDANGCSTEQNFTVNVVPVTNEAPKGPKVDFEISSGTVVPKQCVNTTVTVLGCAIKEGGVGKDYPVIVQVSFGSKTVDPFGTYSGYNKGSDVNDHVQHNWNSAQAIAANTTINVKAKSINPNTGSMLYERSSAGNNPFVKVLRNGDTPPAIIGFAGQADVETYMQGYIVNGKMKLDANQAIYLFELGSSSTTSASCDYQDCVVLVTMSPSDCPEATNTQTTTPVIPPLALNIASSNNVSCAGNSNGNVSFSSDGGLAPVSFDWSPRNGSISGKTISGLRAGIYTITARDANNSVTTAQVTITEPSAINASVTVNGSGASVSVSGGTFPYSYRWTPGNSTGSSVSGLANGNYSVKITDANGCSVDKSFVINVAPVVVEEEKITICHIPPGNPDNPQSITIPKSALSAHLAHGDHVGACTANDVKTPVNDTPKDNTGGDKTKNTDDGNKDNDKITICHIPPGNPDNPQSITISRSALAAHLAHGDHVGECVAEDTKNNTQANPDKDKNNNTNNNTGNTGNTGDNNDANDKITICHIPPGNPDNPQSISIPRSALAAHLAHGDQVGECQPKVSNADAEKAKQDEAEKQRKQKELEDQQEQARKQKELEDQQKQKTLEDQQRKQKELEDQQKLQQQQDEQRKQQELQKQQQEQQRLDEEKRKQKELDDQVEQQRKQKELEDQKQQQQQDTDAQKQKALDDQKRQQDEDAQKQKALDDQKRQQDEDARKQKALDDQKRQQDEDAQKQKALDDQKRQQDEDARKQKELEDQQKAQQQADEQKRQQDEQARKQKELEDQQRQQQQQLDEQKRQQDEAARKQKELEDQQRQQQQQQDELKRQQDEQARKQKQLEDQQRQQQQQDEQKKNDDENKNK